jgi:hypothetical protein
MSKKYDFRTNGEGLWDVVRVSDGRVLLANESFSMAEAVCSRLNDDDDPVAPWKSEADEIAASILNGEKR